MARYSLPIATALLTYSGFAPALGLGEITLSSALNQPLDARFALLDSSALEPQDVRVGLASSESFQRQGVERFAHLSDLTFVTERNGTGLTVRVTSSKPIREPYLDFIVEVARPNGLLQREYTLLIDPPELLQPAPPSRPTLLAQSIAGPVSNEPAANQAAPVVPTADKGQTYRVQSGDSLWLIAGRLSADSSPSARSALMQALHALNPGAFAGGDIAKLKLGATLLLPDTIDGAPSSAPAQAKVAASSEATEQVQPTPAPVPQSTEAELEALLRPDELEAAAAASVVAQPQSQMPATDISSDLDALQARLSAMHSLIEMRNQQLDELANSLAQRAVAQPAAPAQPRAVSDTTPAQGWMQNGWLAAGVILLMFLASVVYNLRLARRSPVEAKDQSTPEPRPLSANIPAPAAVPRKASAARRSRSAKPAPLALNALESASMLISASRFGEAKRILESALVAEPERVTLRLLLLEMLGQLGEREAFSEQYAKLRQQGASSAQLEEVRVRHAKRIDPQQTVLGELAQHVDNALGVSPLSRRRGAVLDPNFRSNLHELPEVVEMTLDQAEADAFEQEAKPGKGSRHSAA